MGRGLHAPVAPSPLHAVVRLPGAGVGDRQAWYGQAPQPMTAIRPRNNSAVLACPCNIELDEIHDRFLGYLPVEVVLHDSNDLVTLD